MRAATLWPLRLRRMQVPHEFRHSHTTMAEEYPGNTLTVRHLTYLYHITKVLSNNVQAQVRAIAHADAAAHRSSPKTKKSGARAERILRAQLTKLSWSRRHGMALRQ